ncbi:MAG: IS5 family transposase, partial [Comamonas sp.]
KYRTTNWSEYNEVLKRRGSLMAWIDADLQWQAPASGRPGRPAVFSDAAVQFCLTLTCMFGLGHRSAALYLLIDCTGVKMLGEGEWKTKKHGADYRRQWRKVHLGIDAKTLEIRAIEITDNAIGDAPMLPELLAQIPEDEPLHSVSADGAYDTKACHEATASRQAAAIMPTRKNAKPWADDKAGARARNEILRATRRLGRSIWKKWSGYHRRSFVETKMGCFKRLGERVMARDFERQVTALQIRASILNRFTSLGTPQTVRVA